MSSGNRRPVEELWFPAMGCKAHVVVVGGPAGLVDRAAGRVAALESLWSRFREDSDVSRCNAAAGSATASIRP